MSATQVLQRQWILFRSAFKSSQVSIESQELLHKKGKIMQNASVNIISIEAALFSKQTPRNA